MENTAAETLIREVQAEIDAQELARRKYAIKLLLLELKAARQVVKSLEGRLEAVASGS
jgi:hypothetical protein